MNEGRLLWILPYLPWPTTSGGKLRQYHLLRELARRGFRITLLVQSKLPLTAEIRAALEPWLEQLIVWPRRPLLSLRTLLSALTSRHPLLASVNGFSPQLTACFEKLLEQPWDIVQIEHSYTMQPYSAALQRRQRAFILSEHNLESALSAATYAKLPVWIRPLARLDHRRYQRWERAMMRQATAVIALTESDARVFRRLTSQPVYVVVNGAELASSRVPRPAADARRALFIGNFEYAPNRDAVHWLMEEIMPRLWRLDPQARLSVCGYRMPPQWSKHWTDPRVEWLGYIETLSSIQARSSLFIAPLRDGGGSKLKVLEAMAAGLPVVSTSQGVSGLAATAGRDYLHGEDADALATRTAELLRSPERAANLGATGRRYVQTHHSWVHAADQLETIYREMIGCA